MAPVVLKQLLSKPFGPFRDSEILNPSCKSIRTKPLELKDVVLRGDGKIVGLDTTEPYQKEHENYKTVKISGTLEIMELSWLSESGRRRLETALHERSNSPLTLERLYGTRTSKHNGKSGLTIKVNIVATKSMTVGYLTSDHVSNGLRIDTVNADCHRWFLVTSMQDSSFQKSRLFLGRYRTLRVLRDALEYDQKIRRSNEPTLHADRAPVWFARLYLRRMRELAEDEQAAVHLSSEESDSEHIEHSIRPYQIRALRHQSKRDILRLFRKHASWLIHDQEIRVHKQKRLFDPASWRRWLSRGEDADEMFADDESGGSGDDNMDVDDHPRLSAVARGKRKASDRSPERDDDDNERSGTRLRQRSPTPQGDYQIDTHYQRDYDPDFSPSSDPDWNPSSEPSNPSRPPTPDSPTLRDRVRSLSTAFYHEPDPPKSALWYCPVETCYYCIDLLDLDEEQLSALDQDVAKRLTAKVGNWNLHDDWVMQACKAMSRAHYHKHLRSAHVKMWWDKWNRPRLAYANENENEGTAEEQQEDAPGRSFVKQEDN
ncbi:hypothetical protein QCA50_001855 [Cerrena zonata]|uniref:Uncharacterized protein n=1 Tax=Cerrena zonata TaxID=2478898 RepID=A0AAW0GRX9_9APHY